MIEDQIKNALYERLKQYLSSNSKKYDVSQMVETMVLLLENYFDFDYKKFLDAIEMFNLNKNNNQNVKYSDQLNRIDISKSKSVSVKGFLSKNSPMLFFYTNDDENPCVKIKTSFEEKNNEYSIEFANNSDVLLQYKKDDDKISDGYVINYEYNYSGRLLERTKNIFAEAQNLDLFKSIDDYDLDGVLSEYKNFLVLLENSLSSQHFKISSLSEFGLDILINSFYAEIKNNCLDEYNFSLENIMYLINNTIYDDKKKLEKPNSIFLDFVDDVSYEADTNSNKKVKLKVPVSDKVIEYDVVKSEKYLCVDAIEKGKKKCGIMVLSTGDGFSLCVTNKTSDKVSRPSFVMNFSENQVRVMTIDSGLNKEGQNLIITLTFDNGKIKLNYSNSEIQKIKNYKELNLSNFSQMM